MTGQKAPGDNAAGAPMLIRALPGPSVRHQLLWFVCGVIVVSGLTLAFILVLLRGQAIRAGERLTESFAHVIAEQTTRSFQAVDQRLQITADRLGVSGSVGKLDAATGKALLREEIAELPFVRALSVIDATGRVIQSSESAATGSSAVARAYFQIYLKEPSTRFYIGPPVLGQTSGAWLISATRPLLSTTGAFEGLVMAAIELPYFDQLWQGVDLGKGGSITLFRRDGLLMMRSPFDEASVGKAFPDISVVKLPLDKEPSGHFRDVSVIDGTNRLFAYRVLPAHPEFVVVVGQAYDLVLGPWRQLSAIALSVWAFGSIVIVALAVSLNAAWLQRARTETSVAEMAQRLTLATEASSIGVWDWDLKADSWYATPTYFTMLGYTPGLEVGRREQWLDHVHPDDRERVAANIQAALAGADVPYRHDARVLHADGAYRWISVIGRVLARDEAGHPSRLLGVTLDVTESKRVEEALRGSLQEKEALLREVHHRVKNNLQVISSLLRLETSRSAEGQTRVVLKDMQGRIRSMALLHEALYRTGRFARVDLADYLRQLSTQLVRAQSADPGHVRLVLDLLPVEVDIDQAIPCGLIVNELLTNSLKHAFPGPSGGEVRVFLGRDVDGQVRIRVSDTGPGLPADFDSRRGKSLGLQLVTDLARQLRGGLEIEPGPSTAFAVVFQAALPTRDGPQTTRGGA